MGGSLMYFKWDISGFWGRERNIKELEQWKDNSTSHEKDKNATGDTVAKIYRTLKGEEFLK